MTEVMLTTTVPVDDIVGVVTAALPVKEQGDDSARQIARPIVGGDLSEIGPLVEPGDIEKMTKPTKSTDKPKEEVKVEEVSTNLEIAKAAVEVSVSVAEEKDAAPLIELKETIKEVEKTVADAIDAKVKEEVAKVEVEVAETKKQKKQDELKVVMEKASTEKTDMAMGKLQVVKKEFDEAKKDVEKKTETLAKETAKKETLEAKVEKQVEMLEDKKSAVAKVVVPEVKKMIETVTIKPEKPVVEKKAAPSKTIPTTKPPMLPTAIDEKSPEVIVKTDCDFLKQAELVTEFFLDKKDKKCYGMASATLNGTKQLFAVQCETNMVGTCPTELSMDTCKVSSLTTQKLADLF